jgi:hypothetical protein
LWQDAIELIELISPETLRTFPGQLGWPENKTSLQLKSTFTIIEHPNYSLAINS